MIFALPLVLAAGLAQAAPSYAPPHIQQPPAVELAISPVSSATPIGREVTLKIVVTNVSAVPQYLSADTPDTLQYDVRDSTGHTLVGYQDPPPPPRVPPYGYSQLIWLRPGQAFVFYQHMPLRSLGISEPGRYKLSGALYSYIYTKQQWVSKYQSTFTAFAPRVTLNVVSGGSK